MFECLRDHKKSEEYYKKQLDISSVTSYRRAVAVSYKSLGRVCRITGEYDRAYEYLERARVISFDIADIQTEVFTLLQLSFLKLSQSKTQEAFSYLHQCIAKYETLRKFQQGNEQFQLALEIFPTSGSVHFFVLLEILKMLFMSRSFDGLDA